MTQISGLFNREEGAQILPHLCIGLLFKMPSLRFARVAVLIRYRYCKDPDPIFYLEFIPPGSRIMSLFQELNTLDDQNLSFFCQRYVQFLWYTVQGAGCFHRRLATIVFLF